MKYRVFLVPEEIFQSFNPKTHEDTPTAGGSGEGNLYERLKD